MVTLEEIKQSVLLHTHRTEPELIFLTGFINNNWDDEYSALAVQQFVMLFKEIPVWSHYSIVNFLAVSPGSQELKKWLFTSTRCQAYYVIFLQLQEKISEYQTRSSYEGASAALEAANHKFTGRGPHVKLAAAQALEKKLIELALQTKPSESSYELLSDQHKAQVEDGGGLFKLYMLAAMIIDDHNRVRSMSRPVLTVKSFGENFNLICYQYLRFIKGSISYAELMLICLNQRFQYMGAYLSMMPDIYDGTFDYTRAYFYFMSGLNNACLYASKDEEEANQSIRNNDLALTVGNILDKLSCLVYENPVDILALIKTWLKNNDYMKDETSISYKKARDQLNLAYKQYDFSHVYLTDPRSSDRAISKFQTNFGTNSDAMASTNMPSIMEFMSDLVLDFKTVFLRIGCQTRTVDAKVEVYPCFQRYLTELNARRLRFESEKAKSDSNKTASSFDDIDLPDKISILATDAKTPKPINFLYISNLRSDNSLAELEATYEGHRNLALLNTAKEISGFEVVILPANRSFLAPMQREYGFECLLLNSVIAELAELVEFNGQDFYLSPRVRELLFGEMYRDAQGAIINTWIEETLDDLYPSNARPRKISASERQRIAGHFFKFTLTDKLITTLKPERVAMPCKDNIDRGAAHSMYYYIIKKIKQCYTKLENPEVSTEQDLKTISDLDAKIKDILTYDLHCAALLVKGRIVNRHNFDLLVHLLEGFMLGSYGKSSVFPDSLRLWITSNSLLFLGLTKSPTSSDASDLEKPDCAVGFELCTEEDFRIIDKDDAKQRAVFAIPASTTLPAHIAQTVSGLETLATFCRKGMRVIKDDVIGYYAHQAQQSLKFMSPS